MDKDETTERAEVLVEHAKIGAFGDKADLARHRTVGSTISETTKISLDVLLNPDLIANMPLPWTENREMIVGAFTEIFHRSYICPGTDKPHCCSAATGKTCFPQWKEREDPEWYAKKISLLLSQVNGRIQQKGELVPALVADEAFELGCLFTEAVIKFNWDEHAKRGLKTVESAREGGEKRRINRPHFNEIVAEVDALVARGTPKMAAYRSVAGRYGVSWETIRSDVRAAKKSVVDPAN